jgi:hypothetical protein
MAQPAHTNRGLRSIGVTPSMHTRHADNRDTVSRRWCSWRGYVSLVAAPTRLPPPCAPIATTESNQEAPPSPVRGFGPWLGCPKPLNSAQGWSVTAGPPGCTCNPLVSGCATVPPGRIIPLCPLRRAGCRQRSLPSTTKTIGWSAPTPSQIPPASWHSELCEARHPLPELKHGMHLGNFDWGWASRVSR